MASFSIERASPGKSRGWPWMLATGTVIVAILAGLAAFCSVWKGAPQAVLAIDGSNAKALARQADQRLAAPKRAGVRQAAALASESIRSQAINPQALRILGLALALDGKQARAQHLMRLSERLSRRNLGVHLWEIEKAVAANDVRGALRHYDLALRTSKTARSLLLERLVGALSEPEIRAELVPYVRTTTTWLPLFLSHAAANRANGPALAQLAQRAGGLPDGEVYQRFEIAILGYLIDAGQFTKAQDFYQTWRDVRPALLTSPTISPDSASSRYAPVGWHLRSEPSYGASFIGGGRPDRQGSGMAIEAFAEPGFGGVVASKPLLLAPGRYALTFAFGEVTLPQGAYFGWALRCIGQAGGFTIAIHKGQLAVAAQRSTVLPVEIPANCPGQWLDLDARGGSGTANLVVTVDAANLVKLSSVSAPDGE